MTWYADYRDDYLATGSGRPRLIGRHRTIRRLTLRPNDVHQLGDVYPLVTQPSRTEIVRAVLNRATINSSVRFQMAGVRRELRCKRRATSERLRATYNNMGSTPRLKQARLLANKTTHERRLLIRFHVNLETCPTHGTEWNRGQTRILETTGRGEANVYCNKCGHWWHLTSILPEQEVA